jgi:serralysin
VDTLDYGASAGSVQVDLHFASQFLGDAQGDLLSDVENVAGSAQRDFVQGNDAANAISGGAGDDFVRGFGGNDVLTGGTGADEIHGDAGNDRVTGGLGRDFLTGDAGADRFVFATTAESAPTADGRDRIFDFRHADHDLLDLSAVDGDAGRAGHQALAFVGQAVFGGVGQVRTFFEGDHTVVEVNTVAGDAAEMQVQFDSHVTLAGADFLL